MAATKYVKFLRGTKEAYNNLATKDSNTLYFIYESPADAEGDLYLGSMKLTGDTDLNTISIDALKDVLIDNTTLSDNSFLVYDAFNKQWINKEFDELFTPFAGAEADIAGIAGFVPAPEAGQTNLFLRSDGIWAPIPTGGGATGND